MSISKTSSMPTCNRVGAPKGKEMRHAEVRYRKVYLGKIIAFSELLTMYKLDPEADVDRGKDIEFLEGPGFLKLKEEIKNARILERDDLTAEEQKLKTKWDKAKEDKLNINPIIAKAKAFIDMTETENYIVRAVTFLRTHDYAKRGIKPSFTLYKNYVKGIDKSKVDRLKAIAKGIGPTNVLNECKGEISKPRQELMGASEAARYTAMEKLLTNFQLGLKDLRRVDTGDLVIESTDFLVDKQHILKCLYNTASLLGINVVKKAQKPVEKTKWPDAKSLLNNVLERSGPTHCCPSVQTLTAKDS